MYIFDQYKKNKIEFIGRHTHNFQFQGNTNGSFGTMTAKRRLIS